MALVHQLTEARHVTGSDRLDRHVDSVILAHHVCGSGAKDSVIQGTEVLTRCPIERSDQGRGRSALGLSFGVSRCSKHSDLSGVDEGELSVLDHRHVRPAQIFEIEEAQHVRLTGEDGQLVQEPSELAERIFSATAPLSDLEERLFAS